MTIKLFEPIVEFIQFNDNKPVLDSSGLPVLAPMPAVKTTADIERLVSLGKPQAVIEKFAELVSIGEQWQFAHEYITYLSQLAKAEAHNADLPIVGKDDNGDDILAEPVALPEPPEKPTVKSVEEVLAPYDRTLFKNLRADKVGNLTVEVDGLIFDGDETSTERMNQRIQIMSDTDTILWTLANNDVQKVTKAQLFNAFKRAVDEQSKLWN